MSTVLKVRSPKFSWRDDDPRYWFDNCSIKTNALNALSTLFPAGERFFIQSIVAFKDQVTDETLKQQIDGFVGQEGAHTREHSAFNQKLVRSGYPVDEMTKLAENLLKQSRNHPSRRPRYLAVTTALEHCTTIFCTMTLSSSYFTDPMQGDYQRLWGWHCIEEIEHKAVAFDVYQACVGSYRIRLFGFIEASIGLAYLLFRILCEYQATDKRLFNLSDWFKLFVWTVIWPGIIPRLAWRYFSYLRPGFHPNDFNDEKLLHKWKEKLKIE
ncbi:MAG: metal-dependent hydrolase [Gammaproteobacteria bacterium]|nr:MAG: metal-dependent hydrolase [Gammaproteobacteria bacterium]